MQNKPLSQSATPMSATSVVSAQVSSSSVLPPPAAPAAVSPATTHTDATIETATSAVFSPSSNTAMKFAGLRSHTLGFCKKMVAFNAAMQEVKDQFQPQLQAGLGDYLSVLDGLAKRAQELFGDESIFARNPDGSIDKASFDARVAKLSVIFQSSGFIELIGFLNDQYFPAVQKFTTTLEQVDQNSVLNKAIRQAFINHRIIVGNTLFDSGMGREVSVPVAENLGDLVIAPFYKGSYSGPYLALHGFRDLLKESGRDIADDASSTEDTAVKLKKYIKLQEYWDRTYKLCGTIESVHKTLKELERLPLTSKEKAELTRYITICDNLIRTLRTVFGKRYTLDPKMPDLNAEIAKVSQNLGYFFAKENSEVIASAAIFAPKMVTFLTRIQKSHNIDLSAIHNENVVFSGMSSSVTSEIQNIPKISSQLDMMYEEVLKLKPRSGVVDKDTVKKEIAADPLMKQIKGFAGQLGNMRLFTGKEAQCFVLEVNKHLPSYLRAFLLAKNLSPTDAGKLNLELITPACWEVISAKYEAIEELLSHGLSKDKLLAALSKLGIDLIGLDKSGTAKIGTQLKGFYYRDQIENPVLRKFIEDNNIVVSRAKKETASTLELIERVNNAISEPVDNEEFTKLLNAIGVSGFKPGDVIFFQKENQKINGVETVPLVAEVTREAPTNRQGKIRDSALPEYIITWLESLSSKNDGAPLNLNKLDDTSLAKLLEHPIDIYKLFGGFLSSRKISVKLRELGVVGLNEKDVREIKEFRYLNQIRNTELSRYIQQNSLKIKSSGEATSKVIEQLNAATKKLISDEEFKGLLQKLGLAKIDDASFLTIKGKNLRLQNSPTSPSQVLIQEALLKLELNNTFEQDGYIFTKQKSSDAGAFSYYVIHRNELLGKGAFGAVAHAYPLKLQQGKWEEDKATKWVAKIFQDQKFYSPEEIKILKQHYSAKSPLQHNSEIILLMESLPGKTFQVSAQDINVISVNSNNLPSFANVYKKGSANIFYDEKGRWGVWREDTNALIFVDNQSYPVAKNELQKIGLLQEQLRQAIPKENLPKKGTSNVLRNLAVKVASCYQSDYILHPLLGRLTFTERVGLATQLLLGLNSMHHEKTRTGKPIVHGDLKGSNIRISIGDTPIDGSARKISAAIIDFGTSVELDAEGERFQLHGSHGTPSINMPPEMMNAPHKIGTKSDVWALAPILLRIFGATNPYDPANLRVGEGATFNSNYLTKFNKKGLLEGITNGMPQFSFDVKKLLEKFIDRMADPDYEKRVGTDEALRFLTSLNQLCHLPQPPAGTQQDAIDRNLYGTQIALLAHGLWDKAAIYEDRGVETCLNSKYGFASNPKACQEIINLATVNRLNEENVPVVIELTQGGHSMQEEAQIQFDNAKQHQEYAKLNRVDWQTALAEPISQLLKALHEGRFKAAFEIKKSMGDIIARLKGVGVGEIGADDIFSFLPSALALSNCDLQEYVCLAGTLLNKMTGKWKDGRDEQGAVSLLSVLQAGLALQKTIKYFADFDVCPNPKESIVLQFTKTFEIIQNGVSQQPTDISQLSSEQKICLQDGINDYLGEHGQLSDKQAQELNKVILGYKDYFPKIKALHEEDWQFAFGGFRSNLEELARNTQTLDNLLVDMRHKILDRRSFVIKDIPNLGRVRVFPPRKAQIELDYADVFGRGLDLSRAVLTILKSHYHNDAAKFNISVAKLKELLLGFRELIKVSQKDVKASVKNLQQFNSALISLVSDEEKIIPNHGVAKKAIDQIRDFLWKFTWQNEAHCTVSENPKESGQDAGLALQFARPVKIPPSVSNPKSPWYDHANQDWYKTLSSKYGPWFDRFFTANVDVLQTLATTSMMRNIPNPANAYYTRTILTNREGNISSINHGITHAAMTEAYEVKNPTERSKIATWNRQVLLGRQERESIVRDYFIQNQGLSTGDVVTIPILHQTLLGLSDVLQKSGTALENKGKANAAMRSELADNRMFRHRETGEIVICKSNHRPINSTAYQRIEFDILETNNCINSFEKLTHTRNRDVEDARKLVGYSVDRLQSLQHVIPVSQKSISKDLSLVVEFLKSSDHSIFTPYKAPSSEVKTAMKRVSDYLREGFSIDTPQIGKNLALSLQAAVGLKCTTHETWLGSLRRNISNIPIIGRPISAVLGLIAHLTKIFIPPVWMHWLKNSSTCRKSVYKSFYERLLTQSLGGQVMGGCMSGVDRAGEINQQCLAQERMFNKEGRIVAYDDSPEEKNRFLVKYGSTVGKHILAGVMLDCEATSDGGIRPPKSTAGLMCDYGRENCGGETKEEQTLSKLCYKPLRHCKENKIPFFSHALDLCKKALVFLGLRDKEPNAFQGFVDPIRIAKVKVEAKGIPMATMSASSPVSGHSSALIAEIRRDGYQAVAIQDLDPVSLRISESEIKIPELIAQVHSAPVPIIASVPAASLSTSASAAAAAATPPPAQVTASQVASAAFQGAISITTVAVLMGVPILAAGAALFGLGSMAIKLMATQKAEKAAQNSAVAAGSVTKAGFFASNVGRNGYSQLPAENVPYLPFEHADDTNDRGAGLVRSLVTVLWGGLIFCGYHLFSSLFA